jgi:uncharacterized protein (UPF0332 family)
MRKAEMLVQEHVQTAREFLEAADREFAAGDVLQGSEKMWGAASHAVMALAQQHGLPYGSNRSLSMAVRKLSEEYDDPALSSRFAAAEIFRANSRYDFMEDFQIDNSRELAQDFIERVLALVDR